ncbi:MAG: helix-turn-helix domain-containing protein [Verrucomicrobiaceae bacterium]|nr:helix-turn-helix domain-containing protein [Verrucomicrobiaceae bacterium]
MDAFLVMLDMGDAWNHAPKNPELARIAARQRAAAERARHPSRVVRRHLKEQALCISPRHIERGMGHILRWLRKRRDWHATQVARKADVGDQTVRDLEHGLFERFAWDVAYRVCAALGTALWRVEHLTWRWLQHDYQRQRTLHRQEPVWKYEWPWSKNRANFRIRKARRAFRPRNTGFASRRAGAHDPRHERDPSPPPAA